MGTLGTTIAALRNERGLSQAQLSEGLCSRSHLSHIERGEKLPSPDLLASLAGRLGVPVMTLAREYLQESIAEAELLGIADILAEVGAVEEAWSVLEAAKHSMQKHEPTQFVRGKALEVEGYLHFRVGDYGKALVVWQALLELRKRTPSRQFFLARAYYWVGHTAIRLGNMDLANRMLSRGFSYILAINPHKYRVDTEKITSIHHWMVLDLGHVLLYRREFAGALFIYETALNRWREYAILAQPDPGVILGYGISQLGTGRLQEAERTFIGLLQRQLPAEHEYMALSNLGISYRLQGNWGMALEAQERALALCTAAGYECRGILNELVRIHLERGELQEAEERLKGGPGPKSEGADPTLVVETQILRATLARRQESHELAEEYLSQASAVEGASGAMQSMLYLEYIRLYSATGHNGKIPGILELLEQSLNIAAI